MPLSFTPAQQAAVRYSRGNLLLSAAAGSGKTAALTARIAGLAADGSADLSEMLVVTYTRAAAAEMRERIGARLREALEAAREDGDDARAARAARAVAALPSAKISTIHAFLYQALRPYFPVLGLSPDARILEERTVETLRAEVMQDTVDDAFNAPAEATENCASFPELCDIIGQARDADAVDGELLWLEERLTSAGGNADTLLAFADSLDAAADGGRDILSTLYGEEIRSRTRSFAAHYLRILDDLSADFPASPKVAKQYGPVCEDHCRRLREIEACASDGDAAYPDLARAVLDLSFEKLPPVQKKDATDASEAFRFFRDEMKKEHHNLAEDFFSGDAEEAARAAGMTARILRRAAAVLGDFSARLAARKRDMAALDYGDLETCALRLFLDGEGKRTRAAEEIGSAFRYVFIDEYQDTNDVQDRIFRALTPHACRFMVGDIKQSIYRFRGADPSVFAGYREAWPIITPEEAERSGDAAERWEGTAGRSLFMSENFRCAAPVVDFVNAVSRHLLPSGGIPFEDGDLLLHGRGDDPENPPVPEIVVVENPRRKSGEEPDEGGEADPEVEYVADRIASMIGRYHADGHILAPADTAILLRSNRFAALYRDALGARGIPAVMKTSRPLGSYPSVMLLVCLLNFVDNPLRDVYAAGALRSPVFGADMGMMIAVREAAGDLPLWAGVCALAKRAERAEGTEGTDPALAAVCRNAVNWLGYHKRVSRGLPADKYLETLLRDTDFFSLDGIRGSGAERDAVNRFQAAVRAYENGVGGRIGGLSGLLEGLPDLLDAAEDTGGGGKSPNAVSILSIHAAKGLEFPVCFVSECARRRNREDEMRTVLYDRELGLGMTLPDPGGLARCDTLIRQCVSAKISREAVREEMRMLYVALTRARDRLIVTGKASKPDDLLDEAEEQARYADGFRAETADSYLVWMLEAAERFPGTAQVTVIPAEKDDGEADAEQPDSRTETPPEQIPLFPPEPDPAAEAARRAEEAAEEERERLIAALKERFAFRYGDGRLRRIPAKLTVSRLSPEILDGEGGGVTLSLDPPRDNAGSPQVPPLPDVPEEQDEEREKPAPKRPAFMTGGKQATAADRGSATHMFFQFTDFAALRERGVKAEIDRLIRERYLSPGTASLIYEKQIERFRESALLDSLLRSPMVKREFRFNVLLPAERFTGDPEFAAQLAAEGIRVTVQGVVDCVYRDPDTGTLVLIDYKTDALTAEERRDPEKAAAKLTARHRDQLFYYREICEEMFGEAIPAAYLYSTVLGRVVRV